MELEMVLNELSVRPADDIHTARQRMSELMLTAHAATKHGVKSVIRTLNNLDTEELAPEYPIARWRNDGNVDIETRRFYKTLVTKAPFLNDIIESNILNTFNLSDCFYGQDRAIGLGVAFWLEALAVSFRSEPRWLDNQLQLRISKIDDNDEIEDIFENIPHASSSYHIQDHLIWIQERLPVGNQVYVRDGLDIWLHRIDWFPNLYFCDNVREQMQTLAHGDLMLLPIMKRLHELENFCKTWNEGPFDRDKMPSKVTTESEITIAKYSPQRTFRCPDGVVRTFSWHSRLTPRAWRLYFYPLPEELKLIVGYIGPHLPTDLHAH